MADTTFGTDASHYDAPLAVRDGLDFYTHKLTDGDHFFEDVEFGPAMGAARSLGIPILGAYHVLHGGRSIANQAAWLIARADALTPWWRTHDCWIWQCDAEPFSYLTAPSIEEVNAFGDAVCARADCPAQRFLAYAPAWHYGSSLTRLRYRLWHSNYGANPVGAYRAVYPGNTSSRWTARTGTGTVIPVDPLLLQYGSNTTIAGQTTCDANAFRGTLDQLRAALHATTLGGDMADFTSADPNAWHQATRIDAFRNLAERTALGEPMPVVTLLRSLAADVAALKTTLAALAATGTVIDVAAVLAKMQELADVERARDEVHVVQVQALQAELARVRADVEVGLSDAERDAVNPST